MRYIILLLSISILSAQEINLGGDREYYIGTEARIVPELSGFSTNSLSYNWSNSTNNLIVSGTNQFTPLLKTMKLGESSLKLTVTDGDEEQESSINVNVAPFNPPVVSSNLAVIISLSETLPKKTKPVGLYFLTNYWESFTLEASEDFENWETVSTNNVSRPYIVLLDINTNRWNFYRIRKYGK